MSDKHIRNLRIQNFKCFEEFELKDIGQFNLIVGDNNVGKTSLLESVLVLTGKNTLAELAEIFVVRENISDIDSIQPFNFLKYSFYCQDQKNQISFSSNRRELRVKTGEYFDFESEMSESEIRLYGGSIATTIARIEDNSTIKFFPVDIASLLKSGIDTYWPYICSTAFYDNDLVDIYGDFIQRSKSLKNALLVDMKSIIPDILDIEMTRSFVPEYQSIGVRIQSSDELLPLSSFGDGASKMFRILAEIIASEDRCLQVDEIDSGLHHSRFEIFWKTVIKSAIRHNVQIFATTHNEECLRYFHLAMNDPELKGFQSRMRHFVLKRKKDNSIKAYKFDFEQFESSLESGNEIRG